MIEIGVDSISKRRVQIGKGDWALSYDTEYLGVHSNCAMDA